MANGTFYIQGYKLDPQKIRHTFPREEHEPEEIYHCAWYQPIIELIPETAYKYVGCGVEPDGHLNLVLVLEDGTGTPTLNVWYLAVSRLDRWRAVFIDPLFPNTL